MAEVNIRYVTDERDNIYYPMTHMDAIEGFDMSAFEDITEIRDVADTALGEVSNVSDEISSLRSSISSLQNAVANIPSVYDTGWQNISLASGVESYSSGDTPQARMMVINEVTYLSLRGSVKGVTTSSGTTVGTIPSSMTSKINLSLYYVQNTTTVSSKLNYTRMMLSTSGVLTIQGSTIESPTATQWYPIHQTFML